MALNKKENIKKGLEAIIQHYLEPRRGRPSYHEVEIILQQALKIKRSELYLSWSRPLSVLERKKIEKALDLYEKGRPLAYIFKTADFFGKTFKVEKGVFIPRAETEILVSVVLNNAKICNEKPFYFMDFGCGSGCIGLSLLARFKKAHLFCVDINKKALEIAKQNAKNFNLEDRVSFFQENVLNLNPEDFPKMEFITANPPYISTNDSLVEDKVKENEPHEALFAGSSGTEIIEAWLGKAFDFFKSSQRREHSPKAGSYFFEIGHDQSKVVKNLFEHFPFIQSFEFYPDLSGCLRVVRVSV